MRATRREALIAGLFGALAAPAAVRAEQFAGTYTVAPEKIADGVWLARGMDDGIGFASGGAIANAVILASDAGPIVVDPGPSLKFGQALAAAAQRLTGKPAGRVVITHFHPDHAFGAGAFDPAIVYALPGTAKGLERDGNGFADAMYRLLSGWMLGTQVTIPRGQIAPGPFTFGGRTLTALALSGHSEADLALLDQATGTLIAGDLVFHDRAPATPSADLAAWRKALDVLAATPHRLLVPGHGPLDSDGTAIAQTRDWLDWLEQALKGGVARGLDMTEAGDMPIPERFSGMKMARYELQRSVSHFYPRFEAEAFPRIDQPAS